MTAQLRELPSVELSYRVMLMHLAYSLLISLVLLACGEAASSRTLVTVSHSGTSLDIRRLPKMMAQAAAVSGAARLRYLNPDDHECEKCFAQGGMIYDLTAIGVQIVRIECSASYDQILSYLKKAKDMLGIDFTCEPDSGFALMPAAGIRAGSRGSLSSVKSCS
ncbi:hypothetical protein FOZ62_007028 [Perkinsus olseni]|uniref:Uncharacterized protein n=1 Tax=Perkinsus olseni TaxID=32597 RepID=A0A7J6QJE6_PEROL|nr:hypothetical protein FOZ62_007028 [Perkinsus olseni]